MEEILGLGLPENTLGNARAVSSEKYMHRGDEVLTQPDFLLLFPVPLPQPQTLQKLKVPIIDSELCKRLYWRGAGQEAIAEDMLCAGYLEGERDACLVSAHPLSAPPGRPKCSITSFRVSRGSSSPTSVWAPFSLTESLIFLFTHWSCREHFRTRCFRSLKGHQSHD